MSGNELSIEVGHWLKATATGNLAVIVLACIVVAWLLARFLRERRSFNLRKTDRQGDHEDKQLTERRT